MRWVAVAAKSAAAGLVLAAGVASGAYAEMVVTISKSQQRMSVAVDGSETYRWTVSTGRRHYTTPSGRFRPVRFEADWHSHKYQWAPMPHSIFFHGGYAIHGTTEVAALGRAASHGCVRLHPSNAATLFSLAREQGARNVRIVVTDAGLDRAREDGPVGERRAPGRDFRAGVPASAAQALARANDDAAASRNEDATPARAAIVKAALATTSGKPSRRMTADRESSLHGSANKASARNKVAALSAANADFVEPPSSPRGTVMVVTSEAQLRAVYRKYNIPW